ncbi:hypothetical protein ACWQOK_000609 [Acinetobacter baumannii]|nr:hypothetical protein [Acinetobacter baumannii]EKW0725304.1 hypothetical protein [Acinetobacter baumannii]EKW6644602.1 hypothetical protein [Acinetobacter baumannii]
MTNPNNPMLDIYAMCEAEGPQPPTKIYLVWNKDKSQCVAVSEPIEAAYTQYSHEGSGKSVFSVAIREYLKAGPNDELEVCEVALSDIQKITPWPQANPNRDWGLVQKRNNQIRNLANARLKKQLKKELGNE